MGDHNGDEMRFLLEDAALEDLLGDLATDDAFAQDALRSTRENPGFFAPLDAAIALPAAEVSLPRDGNSEDTMDGDVASETASQASSDSHSTSSVKKPMVNSTRVRMKQELSYLREKVVELERQLETAKHTAESANRDALQADSDENDAALMNVQCSLWERVARHQRIEKQKAERKNAELRLMLEDQLKVARSLEKALRKRPSAMLSTSLLDELEAGFSGKRICGGANPQDPETFARLTERADRSYEELASIWRRTGFDTCKAERNESQVLVDSSNRLYLEVTTAKIVPFSMRATDRAAWSCISQPKLKFLNGVYHGVKATPDCIHSHSEMWMRVGAAEAHMTMAIVTKRFVEQDRVVYVLESSSIGGGSRDLLQSVQIVEKGWVVLEPVRSRRITSVDSSPGEPEAAPMESTIIQVCMRLMPAVTGDMISKSGDAATGALTDLILAAFRQNLGFLFQTIENMLVEQMIAMDGTSDTDIEKRRVPS